MIRPELVNARYSPWVNALLIRKKNGRLRNKAGAKRGQWEEANWRPSWWPSRDEKARLTEAREQSSWKQSLVEKSMRRRGCTFIHSRGVEPQRGASRMEERRQCREGSQKEHLSKLTSIRNSDKKKETSMLLKSAFAEFPLPNKN